MALTFYPHSEDVQKGSLEDRIEIFTEAAQNFKAAVLEMSQGDVASNAERRIPRELSSSYNWGEIACFFRELRELPEISKNDKAKKAALLAKLAEIYEVLRAAKMPKLEAVRLALINEVNQLRGSGSQVA